MVENNWEMKASVLFGNNSPDSSDSDEGSESLLSGLECRAYGSNTAIVPVPLLNKPDRSEHEVQRVKR